MTARSITSNIKWYKSYGPSFPDATRFSPVKPSSLLQKVTNGRISWGYALSEMKTRKFQKNCIKRCDKQWKKKAAKYVRHFSRFRTFKHGLTTEDNASRFRQRVGSESLHGGHLIQEYTYYKYIPYIGIKSTGTKTAKFLASVVNTRLLFFRGYGAGTVIVNTVSVRTVPYRYQDNHRLTNRNRRKHQILFGFLKHIDREFLFKLGYGIATLSRDKGISSFLWPSVIKETCRELAWVAVRRTGGATPARKASCHLLLQNYKA